MTFRGALEIIRSVEKAGTLVDIQSIKTDSDRHDAPVIESSVENMNKYITTKFGIC